MAQALTNRNSSSIEAPRPDVASARELSYRRSSMVEGGWLPEPIPAPTRAMLEHRQSAVLAALQGASRSDLEEQVSGLMTGFPSMRGLSKLEAQILVRKYADDLEGVPLWAIRAACKDISRGAVSDLNPDFPPSASRVRQQADEHIERLERESKDLRKVLQAKILPPELPPEKAAQINLGFQKLQQKMHRYTPPLEPIEPEKPIGLTKEQLEQHYSKFTIGGVKREDA
jgi:hypothetical protein